MKEIILATKNKGKKKEFQALFSKYNIEVKSLLDFNEAIADVEETGTTFKENAQLKAETISELLNLPVIADDSGLEVAALQGQPGVYSARYAGQPTDDSKNNDKLLKALNNVSNRQAQFTCVLAFAIPGQKTLFATGHCPGKIAESLSGNQGFGYDPLFIPEGYDVTMASLDMSVKNKISHRGNALKHLEDTLKAEGIVGDLS